MDFWDKEERACTLSMEDMEARREARKHYKKWVLLETEITRSVVEEGDRNTRFFYKAANAHRRRNLMARVKINETCLT